jgi:hypothetical protein
MRAITPSAVFGSGLAMKALTEVETARYCEVMSLAVVWTDASPASQRDDLAEYFGETLEVALELADLLATRCAGRGRHRFRDRSLEALFGRLGRGLIVGRPGQGIGAGQSLIGDQFAVDGPREVRFGHAGAVRADGDGDPLEAEIGERHAGGEDGQHRHEAEDDFCAETQGEQLRRARLGFCGHSPTPFHSRKTRRSPRAARSQTRPKLRGKG